MNWAHKVSSAITVGFIAGWLAYSTSAQDAAPNASDDWPQFRGPNGNGVSETATPPTRWSGTENILWKVEIPGSGHSSPIVIDDRIYLLTGVPKPADGAAAPAASPAPEAGLPQGERGRRGDRGGRPGGLRVARPTTPIAFTVLCLDRADGKILWQTVVRTAMPHEGGHDTNTFASASPITDGKHLYAFFGSHGLYCLDMSGHVVWERDLGKLQTRNEFGEGASPALHADTLVVTCDHEGQSFIEAMDAATGETRWKVERDEPTSWATPRIVTVGDTTQVITNGTNRLRSYNLENGELIWECGGMTANPIPTPMTDGEYAYCMTGYRGFAMQAIRLTSQGDVSNSDAVAWSRQDAAPYVASPLLYKGMIYFTKSRDGILYAVDARTGETVIDQSRLEGISSIYASLVAADDKIFVSGREGVTVVLGHGPELNVLSVNDLGEPIDATPALAGKQLFIRGHKHLYCIQDGS